MLCSKYTRIVPYGDKGEYLIFNTLTKALIKAEQDLVDAIRYLPDMKRFKGYDDIVSNLVENGFIVRTQKEERENLNGFYKQLIERHDAWPFEVTILTTFNCNFACAYCFEKGASCDENLTQENIEHIMCWLSQQIEEYQYPRLRVVFYGGEPLLNKHAIDTLVRRLGWLCEQKEIEISFSMITNGYLLNRADVETWLPFGFKDVRFTIDGDRQSHNARRPLRTGAPTFDTIIENMESIIDLDIDVSVTGNYDKDNIENMVALLDYLKERGLLYKLKSVGFSPILPRLGTRMNPARVELTHCLHNYDEETFKMNSYLRKEMIKRALDVPKGLGYLVCPLVSKHNGVVIDPNGLIYKCPTMVGYPEFAVGSVTNSEYNETYNEFIDIKAWERCDKDCPYVPVCVGGCRFMAYVRDGHFKNIWCEKPFLEKMSDELIRLEYEGLENTLA